MIVFDLLCGGGHRFEGWFGSAGDFDSQRERKLLSCPSCGSPQVSRVPSATRANLGAPEPKVPAQPVKTPEMEGKDPFAIAQMLYSKMLDELLTKSEDVGKEFPSEARKIFYKETPARAIRGQATNEEHQDLVDEGIPVARFPVPPTDKLN
ncbi:MAG TPA: DUF1178 family protein [Burkholderiales bacterium]|nr:DUF1178 family protein [Burkholderiales bacterium]